MGRVIAKLSLKLEESGPYLGIVRYESGRAEIVEYPTLEEAETDARIARSGCSQMLSVDLYARLP